MRFWLCVGLFLATLSTGWCLAGDVRKAPLVRPGSEQEAVAALEKIGGRVRRHPKRPGSPVIAVYLHGNKVRDEHLKYLASFKSLEYVQFFSVGLRGDGLAHLKGLKNLYILGLGFTRLSSRDSWRHLKQLQQLQYVEIGYTEIEGKRDPRGQVRALLPRVKIIGPMQGEKLIEARLRQGK